MPDQNRSYINLPNRPAGLPFSDAVLIGNTLYISGRIGIDPATGSAPENVEAEMKLLFEGFQAVLRLAGMNMDDLGLGAGPLARCFSVAAVQRSVREVLYARVSRPGVPGIGSAADERPV